MSTKPFERITRTNENQKGLVSLEYIGNSLKQFGIAMVGEGTSGRVSFPSDHSPDLFTLRVQGYNHDKLESINFQILEKYNQEWVRVNFFGASSPRVAYFTTSDENFARYVQRCYEKNEVALEDSAENCFHVSFHVNIRI